MVPPPQVMKDAAQAPPKKRKTRNMAASVLRAQPMVHPIYSRALAQYIGTRPVTSESGASSNGPIEAPNAGIVTHSVETTVLVIPNSEANSEAPGANMVVAIFLHWGLS
jgi:hypothetical protein